MAEPNIAPDAELFAESLDAEQMLFIITVWNDGGEQGLNELLLFIFDKWEHTRPDERRKIAHKAAERFFSERAYDEFHSYGMRERMRREMEKQGVVKPDDGPRIILPEDFIPRNGGG